ncbi:hypothetical protein C4K40_5505 [Pseudomonas sp. CMR5c]|nr:hypothetical protein C4K40_5505 [Pseudomonas sp. CMR5c]
MAAFWRWPGPAGKARLMAEQGRAVACPPMPGATRHFQYRVANTYGTDGICLNSKLRDRINNRSPGAGTDQPPCPLLVCTKRTTL